MLNNRVSDYYGKNISWLDRLRVQASLKARRKIYLWFKKTIEGVEGKIFLDHGSTPDTLRKDSNCFIQWLLADGAKVYATSPENIENLETVFPSLTVLDYPPVPGTTEKFDCIISSAVIEHVGDAESQVNYLRNLLKLSPNILLTTPNRYHWLEFHTKLPLLHWLPRQWHWKILQKLGMKFWGCEENLRLLSQQDVEKILKRAININPSVTKIKVKWYFPKFLGMVSNLVLLISEDS